MSSKLLDLSLDEAIKQNRTEREKPARSQASRGGGRRARRSDRPNRHSSPYSAPSRGVEAQWRHDLYDGTKATSQLGSRVVVTVGADGSSIASVRPQDEVDQGFVGRTQKERRERESRKPGSVVYIRNLHYNVTDKDLEELMSEVGPLTRVQLLYDHADRSTGEASIGFERVEDGYRAVERYHNMTLDGQRMVLSIAESTLDLTPVTPFPARTRGGIRRDDRGISSRARQPMRSVGDGRGRRAREPRPSSSRKASEPKPTLDELNAQMDDYMQVDG
ncbi:hypothetical protein BJ684DRAFT_18208 [Piptocephalis cylindrospora]|uniref:RRM domain-containing protein n=1 Tax=Piptocephalis cylindrospora TaxID=1907219 RepID=A0A4P9Y8P0_9FUNG|nr:hypothetical protein BJ684DRAFT_18208 [Piptocephalis cylindrospora]|eukprot:RKP15468.1 hypothetical protein BJ684DRAFT_18208 [Piptocephalis cylindrospora]